MWVWAARVPFDLKVELPKSSNSLLSTHKQSTAGNKGNHYTEKTFANTNHQIRWHSHLGREAGVGVEAAVEMAAVVGVEARERAETAVEMDAVEARERVEAAFGEGAVAWVAAAGWVGWAAGVEITVDWAAVVAEKVVRTAA